VLVFGFKSIFANIYEYSVLAGDFGVFWRVLADFGGSEEANTGGTRGKRARQIELSQTLKTPEIARRSGY